MVMFCYRSSLAHSNATAELWTVCTYCISGLALVYIHALREFRLSQFENGAASLRWSVCESHSLTN